MGLGLVQGIVGILQALVAAQHANAWLADLGRQGQGALLLLARPRVPRVFPGPELLMTAKSVPFF